MFFDLSMQVNQTDKLNYERWIYLGAPDNSDINLKVFQYLDIGVDVAVKVG